MKYIMLIYHPDGVLPPDVMQQLHRDCTTWHDELVRSGISVGAFGLQPVSTSTTLRKAEGKTVIMDGPFAETKEILGGFEILECKDLDEAIAVSERFPGLLLGASVEIRATVPGNKCGAGS